MVHDAHYRAVRELMRKIAAQENVMIVRRYAGASGAAAAPVSVKQARSWTALRSEVARHGR
jgi:hypothetical protein